MDRFEDMRCFIHVVDHGSVTRAAETMSIAPSAVSRRIKELEHRLGVQLLARTTRRMKLTDAGQTFYDRSLRILADLEEAEGEVSDASRALYGPLRLAAPLDFGTQHLAPILNQFVEEHDGLTLDLELSDRMADLVGEGFDLALRIGALRDSSLIARKLGEIGMHAVASPGFLRGREMPLRPEDMGDWPALVYSGSERADIWRFRRPDGEEGSVQMTVRLRANNGGVLAKAAEDGLGVTLQPAFVAAAGIDSGRLVELMPDHEWPTLNLYAVYPQTRHLSAKARALIDFLKLRFSAGRGVWVRAMAHGEDAEILPGRT
ncbi:MAG: LysR family transcriptional regulator [Pseudomonadota bacterium]